MNDNNLKNQYLMITDISLCKNLTEISEFFKNFGKCNIIETSESKVYYINYHNLNILSEILKFKIWKIKKKFGDDVKCRKVENIPLELNPPSWVLLLIFYRNKNNKTEITIDLLKEIFNNYKNLEKMTLFKKKCSKQSLLKFDDLEISKDMKDSIPLKLKQLNLKCKAYFTSKNDVVINKNNKNEIDFCKGLNLNKSEEKSNVYSNNTDDIIKKKKLNGDIKYGCLYLKSKTKMKVNEIFNIISLFGHITKIKTSSNFKRILIFFNERNDFISVFEKIKNIPLNLLNFKIILPKYLSEKVHDYFLNGNNNLKTYYNHIIKDDLLIDNTLKALNISSDRGIHQNIYRYNLDDQRRFIRKKNKYNFNLSNIWLFKNLPENLKVFKLERHFRSKINIQQEFSYFNLVKSIKNNYIFICKTIDISINIMRKFHNTNYDGNMLNIQFVNNQILGSFKQIYSTIKEIPINLKNNNVVIEFCDSHRLRDDILNSDENSHNINYISQNIDSK